VRDIRRPRLTPMALAAVSVWAANAWAQDVRDDWYYRQPVPSLPQQLGGIVRPLPEDRRPQRLETLRDVFAMMGTCWRLPAQESRDTGQELSIRMSFNRRGEVIGRPRITYFRPGGGAQARAAFVGSIKAALRLCTPLPLSERLGAALAGRPFVFRFVDARPI
jgi:hypothetical protein